MSASTIFEHYLKVYKQDHKAAARENSAEILAFYRRTLLKTFQHLTLCGLDVDTSDPAGSQPYLELDQVYVALDTLSQVELSEAEKEGFEKEDSFSGHDTRPLSALEAASRNQRLVILGDPGSGKTTFLNHLALRLLMHGVSHDSCDTFACWPKDEADLLPVHVMLRDFAGWITDTDETAEADWLWNFIAHRLSRQKLDEVIPVIETALDNGRAMVLLDGLDEIPTMEKRGFVRDAVVAFAKRYEAHGRTIQSDDDAYL